MNNITKYNIKSFVMALGVLILLLCLCSYISAPQSDSFLEAINPWSSLAGLAFALTYCGLPILGAVIAGFVLIMLILFVLFIVARHIVK